MTRVLDLSGRAGAYCGKLLADLGADVIKVELPQGDALRRLPPFHEGDALPFAYYHHNKRGITLDWERTDAVPLLTRLAGTADAVLATPYGERHHVTGFAEDPPSLAWVNPGTVTCLITPFGATGPLRAWRATPFTSFAMSGYMHAFGPPEGPPLAMPGQQLYDEAGIWAAFTVLASLRCPLPIRDQVIDISAHEVGLFNKLVKDQYAVSGRIATRATNFGPPPGGVWTCRDGRVDIAAHAPHHWDVFVNVLGRPEALRDPLYRDRSMRVQLFDLLTPLIADLLARWTAPAFVEAAQAAGLPCALMQTPAEFVASEQARARGFFVGAGPYELPGAPFLADPYLVTHRRTAPAPGEANREVYVGELGYTPEDLEKWRADGLL